ncbi:MAG: hypothetical protein HFE04_02950 [Bacilli bacterium]|nr:hypothetical protein [Bacilli bacterium]
MKEDQESLYGNDYWLNDVLIRSENKRHYIEGSIEGSKEKQYEIAKNLLKNTNTSLKDISECIGLSLDEVIKLKILIEDKVL